MGCTLNKYFLIYPYVVSYLKNSDNRVFLCNAIYPLLGKLILSEPSGFSGQR